jgi:hypothetical protein
VTFSCPIKKLSSLSFTYLRRHFPLVKQVPDPICRIPEIGEIRAKTCTVV